MAVQLLTQSVDSLSFWVYNYIVGVKDCKKAVYLLLRSKDRNMIRIIVAVVITFSLISYALAETSTSEQSIHIIKKPKQIIDINQPGVLEALKGENPVHYRKIQEMMDGLNFVHPDFDVPGWIQKTFNAHDVLYTPVLMTSDPPKRRISFSLDNTRYLAVVTLKRLKPEIQKNLKPESFPSPYP